MSSHDVIEASAGLGTDVIELLLRLVRIESVNPSLDPRPDPAGESAVVEAVAAHLQSIGLSPQLQLVSEGRYNVLAELPGSIPGVIVLESHLDTVPMPREFSEVREEDGRVWGRGSCDTKASAAAMLVAIERLIGDPRPRPSVIFAGVVDEEFVMKGAEALAAAVANAHGIVIGEPTELLPIRAHNGCVRFAITVHGVTAHSSQAHLGVNAVTQAAVMLTELDRSLGTALSNRTHVLTGVGLLTATDILGGTAPNVVPDECTVRFDRRLTPSETPESALAEVDEVLDRLRSQGVMITRQNPWLEFSSVETDADHLLIQATEKSCAQILDRAIDEVRATGVTYCTDASKLGDLPAVVLGPGSIAQAHTPEEWVEVSQVRLAVELYLDVILRLGESLSDQSAAVL
jgi:acetylornithine deacetylase